MKILAALTLSGVLLAAEPEVISITDLMQELTENRPEDGQFNGILKLPKGTELPMSVLIRGDFFSADTEGETAFIVKVEQDLYIKLKEDDFLASLDGKNWKTMEEFFTGSFGWSYSNNTPSMHGLYLEANLRK